MRKEFRATAYEKLQDLECNGSYLLFSKPLSEWSPTGVTVLVLDTHRGTCVRLEELEVPLGSDVGAWLDAIHWNPSGASQIYFDGDRSVHLGALTAWGAARGVSITIGRWCMEADAFLALAPSLVEVVRANVNVPADLRKRNFEDWRVQYNGRLSPPRFSA